MIRTLVALLVVLPGICEAQCAVFEISATGRGGHGAAIRPQSAPHRLIGALDRIPNAVAEAPDLESSRIVELYAARAINVIPSRASAIVEITGPAAKANPDATTAMLQSRLGSGVSVTLLRQPCSSAVTPAASDESQP